MLCQRRKERVGHYIERGKGDLTIPRGNLDIHNRNKEGRTNKRGRCLSIV